jgi:hypothetical protein
MTSLADTVGMTLPPTDLFIGGRWVASADGGEIDVVDPANAVERLVNPQSRWSFEREASTVLSGLAWAWQSMRWRLLLAHAWCGWRTAALSATRRSAVDRRTATMLYACRDRSYSMRRWWPQNSGVHDGHCWTVGDNAGEDRFCCGGAPARRGGFGHRRADLAVTEI